MATKEELEPCMVKAVELFKTLFKQGIDIANFNVNTDALGVPVIKISLRSATHVSKIPATYEGFNVVHVITNG